jgi:hypothetical protein
VRTRHEPIAENDNAPGARPWLDSQVWLDVDDGRALALQLQEAARQIEEEEAAGGR